MFRVLAAISATLALILTACRNEAPPTDVRQLPRRAITLSPALTEIAFALGAEDRVAGVSQFAVYPSAALEKPVCGGYINPNLEQIIALRPDLILAQGEHAKMRDFCRQRGIRLERVKLDTLEDVLDAIDQVGRLFGTEREAETLRAGIAADLLALKPTLPRERRPRVFACLTRQGGSLTNIMTAGKGSFVDQLIETAGGVNVFGDVDQLYLQISKESLIARRPAVILELRPGEQLDAAGAAALRADWAPLSVLPAVKDGRIEILTHKAILMPTPRVAESVKLLRDAIYREGERAP